MIRSGLRMCLPGLTLRWPDTSTMPTASLAGSLADQDGSLAAFLNPDLTPPERAVAQVEGWILGVA